MSSSNELKNYPPLREPSSKSLNAFILKKVHNYNTFYVSNSVDLFYHYVGAWVDIVDLTRGPLI